MNLSCQVQRLPGYQAPWSVLLRNRMAEHFASVSEDELCQKMYNKTIIEFGFCMISWIIKTLCLYYLPQPSASGDNTDLGFDNSWYHAQPHPIIVYLFIYNNFICNNQYKKAAIREELNPHVRRPPHPGWGVLAYKHSSIV